MNSFLFNRQLGSISVQALAQAQNARLLRSLETAPNVHFTLNSDHIRKYQGAQDVQINMRQSAAHVAGVNSIAIDRFEGRYLLSGGADSSIGIWDLEAVIDDSDGGHHHVPLGHATRTSTRESLGITHLSFYPFDSMAFLTSGYDQTVKLFSSETLKASASFEMGSTVHSHATSGVSTHLLVACASQHPAVRMIDLRSGASTHSLAGHAGLVLAVAWHPKDENILASGASDGTCRLWDIRRSSSSLGVLDMDDSIGIAGHDGKGTGARRRERGKSHAGAVNGVTWTDDGQHLISTGLDERMRVWNMVTGANTLANFGPALKNTHTTMLTPLIAPGYLTPPGHEIIFYPNPQDILSFDMHSGFMLKRLRVVGLSRGKTSEGGVRNINNRTTSLAWRAHNVEMYSGHSDGSIRCWRPVTPEDRIGDESDDMIKDDEEEEIERKRKRQELDEIVRNLTKKQVVST